MRKAAIFLLLAAATIQGQEDHIGPVPGKVSAPSRSSTTRNTSAVDEPTKTSRWFIRAGVVGVIYHPSVTFAASGSAIPNASAHVSSNETVTLDVGYDITRDISMQVMAGVPAKPKLTGDGTVAQLGELGAVLYGPGVLSGLYRVRRWGAFQPYVGPGVAYATIFKDYDGSVSDLHVTNNFGAVVQAGAEYKLGERWSIFGDFKELWLAVNAHGLTAGGTVPVTAHAPLNPSLISAGIKFHFSQKAR